MHTKPTTKENYISFHHRTSQQLSSRFKPLISSSQSSIKYHDIFDTYIVICAITYRLRMTTFQSTLNILKALD